MERDSAAEISHIRIKARNILQSLKALGSPIEYWDHIIVFHIVSKLTENLQKKWEEVVAILEHLTVPPSYAAIDKFLEVARLSAVKLEN